MLYRVARSAAVAKFCVGTLVGGLALSTPAYAITINLYGAAEDEVMYIGKSRSQVGVAEAAPTLSGNGTLDYIMQIAARYWEGIFLDPGTVHLSYGWKSLGGRTLATANQFAGERDFTGAGRHASIWFDGDGSTAFYADDDVTTTNGFSAPRTEVSTIDGRAVVTGQYLEADSAETMGHYDLFSTAIHEMGHILGLANVGAEDDGSFFGSNTILTSGPLAGVQVEATFLNGGHLEGSAYPNALMVPTTDGARRLASEIDIASIAYLSGFSEVNYDGSIHRSPGHSAIAVAAVPLPAPAGMLLLALAALAWVKRRPAVIPAPTGSV